MVHNSTAYAWEIDRFRRRGISGWLEKMRSHATRHVFRVRSPTSSRLLRVAGLNYAASGMKRRDVHGGEGLPTQGEFINWKDSLVSSQGSLLPYRERARKRKKELSRMTYRPIGIVPLRMAGSLSNHLRAPSRQVVRSGEKKKGHERYILWRTGAFVYGGRRQSKRADSPCSSRRVAAGMLYPRSELRDTSTIATNHL